MSTTAASRQPSTLSVVVPTYQRPESIKRAVLSLAVQSRPPDEVIAVARDTDTQTHESIAALEKQGLPFVLRSERVSEPGFMPPVKRGLAVAQSEIVAVMDDDAEAQDDWAARLLPHYVDPAIGAVGGRCINMDGEQRIPSPSTSRVGYVTWLGQFVGNMYCEPTFTEPVEVDFMMGGNMSLRREVAQAIEFDMELNRSVAQGYEVDIGLQVKGMGWRIIFDPRLAIRHYTAPRAQAGMRPDADRESVQWYSYNHARVALRRLPIDRRAAAIAYQLAIGERRAPGVIPLLLPPIARAFGFSTPAARPALRGRILALRSVMGRWS